MKKIQSMTKRKTLTAVLSLLIAFVMLISMTPMAAYAEGETGDPSDPVVTETPEPDPEPEAPSAKVAVKGAGLSVKWQALDSASSYEVYRSYSKTTGFKLLKKDIKGLSHVDLKSKSGKRAYYKVRALYEDGTYSAWSEPASGIIYRVYIETGHGKGDDGVWDSGCRWRKYQKAKLMIPICKSATKYLRAKGVYVYTDAYSGNNRNLNVTLKQVKKYDVSVLLNVHCDYRKAPRGTMPLYRYSDQKKLAQCLNKGVHKYVKMKNRGLKRRTDLRTLNKTRGECTACLFETGNIKKDNRILRKKYDAIGKGLAKGVCDYLGIKW